MVHKCYQLLFIEHFLDCQNTDWDKHFTTCYFNPLYNPVKCRYFYYFVGEEIDFRWEKQFVQCCIVRKLRFCDVIRLLPLNFSYS